MTYIPFDNHYTLTVETATNDGTHHWRNSIDIEVASGTPYPIYTDPIVTDWVSFIQHCQRDDCTIVEVSLRNWARGNVPFDLQAALWLQSTSLPCADYGPGNAYPGATSSDEPPMGEVVMLLAKPVTGGTGRTGHIVIRNSVHGNWLGASAGGPPVLTGVGAGAGADLTAFANTKLASFCGGATPTKFCIVHYSKVEGLVYATSMNPPVFQRVTTHNMGKR